MKNTKKTLKAIVLSFALAAGTMLPASAVAQDFADGFEGLFGKGNSQAMGSRGLFDITEQEGEDEGFSNADFGEESPLGSGIAIMLAAGLGYVALKKKEDKQ